MLGLLIFNHITDKSDLEIFNNIGDLERWADSMHIRRDAYATNIPDLTAMAQALAQYLSRHHLDVSVADENQIKMMQEEFKKLDELLGSKEDEANEQLAKSDLSPEQLYDHYKPQIEAIAQIESSGHKFREHDLVTAGIHKGTRSLSSYGIMPLSIHFLAEKVKEFQNTPVGKEIIEAGGKDPKANWMKIAEITKRHTKDHEAMANLWHYQTKRVASFAAPEHNIQALTAYAHRRGIRGTYDLLKEKDGYSKLLKDPYVQKFLSELSKSTPDKKDDAK
jgi:hypothetical protein